MESREQTHGQPRRALGDGNLLIRIEAAGQAVPLTVKVTGAHRHDCTVFTSIVVLIKSTACLLVDQLWRLFLPLLGGYLNSKETPGDACTSSRLPVKIVAEGTTSPKRI